MSEDLKIKKITDAIRNGKDYAFLSSLCLEIQEIRRDIYERVNVPNNGLIPIYVDEICKPREIPHIREKQEEIADDLATLVSKCKFLLMLFTSIKSDVRKYDHGAPIEGSCVSMWEIELYYAALLGKPVYAFVQKGFEDQQRPFLMQSLNILKLSAITIQTISLSEMVNEIDKIFVTQPKTGKIDIRSYLFHLYEYRKLKTARVRSSTDGDLVSNNWKIQSKEINEDLITGTLNEIVGLKNYKKKITRLYIPYKELIKAPYMSNHFTKFLGSWNILSSNFSSSLSWCGVHGYEVLGVINHLNDLSKIRQRIREIKIEGFTAEETEPPIGGYASEYYSLSKLLPNRKRELLKKAVDKIDRNIKEIEPSNKSGLLAIRGSCFLRLGRSWEAIGDYKEAYSLRIHGKASMAAIGEIECELGYAYFLIGKKRMGIDLWEKGIMKFNGTKNTGFELRAYRKGSMMYGVLGQLDKKLEYQKIAQNIGESTEALGQIEQIKNDNLIL